MDNYVPIPNKEACFPKGPQDVSVKNATNITRIWLEIVSVFWLPFIYALFSLFMATFNTLQNSLTETIWEVKIIQRLLTTVDTKAMTWDEVSPVDFVSVRVKIATYSMQSYISQGLIPSSPWTYFSYIMDPLISFISRADCRTEEGPLRFWIHLEPSVIFRAQCVRGTWWIMPLTFAGIVV